MSASEPDGGPLRLLICGGRAYSNGRAVMLAICRVAMKHGIECIIHGGATGADDLAQRVADLAELEVLRFPADWKTHGKAAGPIRNQQMIDEGKPDAVIAFPGGTGTADMVQRAEAAGIPVWRVTDG